MLNTGAMLAILTTITLDDYYTDQIQEKRQKMKNYADSMKSIGDNVRLWGGSITDTLLPARNMIRPFAVMQKPHGSWKRRWVFRRSIAERSGTILSKRWTLCRPEMIC